MDSENSYLIRNSFLSGFSAIAYSSVHAIINEFFVTRLPKDMFKKISIESSSPGMNRDIGSLVKDALQAKPRLSVNYTIDTDEDNTTYARPDANRLNVVTFTRPCDYPTFLHDAETGVRIQGPFTRIKISMEMEILLDSAMEQQDLLFYLKKLFVFKTPSFFDNFKYEFEIPYNYIEILSYLLDIDPGSSVGASELLKYLNAHSLHPIVISRQPTSGQNKFFFQVKKDRVMMLLNYPQVSKGEKIGRTSRDYRINIDMEVELPVVEDFLLYIPKVIKGEVITLDTSESMEQDSKGVSMTIPSQLGTPTKIKVGDGKYDIYHRMHTIVAEVCDSSYEGLDITEYFSDFEMAVIDKIFALSVPDFYLLFKVGVIEDFRAQKAGSCNILYNEEDRSLLITKSDGDMFNNKIRYTFILYRSKILYNIYAGYLSTKEDT